MKVRAPAVEGRFYPATETKILKQIESMEKVSRYTPEIKMVKHIFGAVLPHAGHLYSGHQTIPFFRILMQHHIYPDTFVIVHPNHSGFGSPIAVDDSDLWVNAVGEVPINREFASAMDLPFDQSAHEGEHSAEVLIPYIQYYFKDHSFKIVAVCMKDQSVESARLVSGAILKAANETSIDIMVLASSDFSHFLPPAVGMNRDQHVLDQILSRNTAGVEQAVKKHYVSVCGYGPVMALMDYSSTLSPDYNIEVLARGHSGEVIRSNDVVDYISIMMYK